MWETWVYQQRILLWAQGMRATEATAWQAPQAEAQPQEAPAARRKPKPPAGAKPGTEWGRIPDYFTP